MQRHHLNIRDHGIFVFYLRLLQNKDGRRLFTT